MDLGHPAITDYAMSKLFGLDWKDHEVGRMSSIMYVHSEILAETERRNKKQ